MDNSIKTPIFCRKMNLKEQKSDFDVDWNQVLEGNYEKISRNINQFIDQNKNELKNELKSKNKVEITEKEKNKTENETTNLNQISKAKINKPNYLINPTKINIKKSQIIKIIPNQKLLKY